MLAGYPPSARTRLEAVRELLLETAAATPGVGPLTETLRWGEAAYLTQATRSGSTVRLGWKPTAPGVCAVYFNCKTTLVAGFRTAFPEAFGFDGNRALLIDLEQPLPEAALAQCLAAALTYHLARRRTRQAGDDRARPEAGIERRRRNGNLPSPICVKG